MSATAGESSRWVEVRVARDDEIELLAEIEARAFPDPWTSDDLAPLVAAGAASGFLAADRGTGETIGFALYQLLPDEAELLRIGVVPELRSRGVGALLLERSLFQLAAAGRPVCHLEVRAANLAARALYARAGFTLVGRRRGYYSDGEDALRYRRETVSGGG